MYNSIVKAYYIFHQTILQVSILVPQVYGKSTPSSKPNYNLVNLKMETSSLS